ncbi:MAG: VanZ family protein [Flavobacteriales bacterium]|nr:VanZ family protein [Flavobacteriales bacterium]
MPGNKLPEVPFSGFDLFVHAMFYLVLSFLGGRFVFVFYPFAAYITLLIVSFGITSIYGVAIELIQEFFITSRTGEVKDILANTIGVLLGLSATKLFYG